MPDRPWGSAGDNSIVGSGPDASKVLALDAAECQQPDEPSAKPRTGGFRPLGWERDPGGPSPYDGPVPPSATRDALRRTAALTGLSVAAVLSARVLLKPRAGTDDPRLLDWETVRAVAHGRTGEVGPQLGNPVVDATYDRYAEELAPLMADVCQSVPESYPPFRVIDRRGFIDQNLVIAQRLLAPVEAARAAIPDSLMTAAGRGVASRYVGELLGFMSHRVLGQYDPVLMLAPIAEMPASALYLVEPNITAYEQRHHVPAESLRRWLILHELTHAWQFESHPWLRTHLIGLMNDMLMTSVLTEATKGPKLPSPRALTRAIPQAVQAQFRGLSQVQAVMSLLEGYSNFVMNQVGRRHLEHFDEIESAFHKRRQQRSLLERIILAVTGMNMKLRQYEIGERFSERVTKAGGLDLLNSVWTEPAMLPTLEEMKKPDLWIRRAKAKAKAKAEAKA